MGLANRVGILGGGQLSRLLIQAAEKLGIQAIPLVESPESPAARVARERIIDAEGHDVDGRVDALVELFSRAKVILFENEFVDCGALASIASELEVEFVPRLHVIQALQDKLNQKKTIAQAGLKSAAYEACAGGEGEVRDWLTRMLRKFPGGAMMKWSKFGYDGYGNLALDAATDLGQAERFVRDGLKRGASVFAEEKITFVRELAITAVQAASGELAYYPLVETYQENGACKWVKGPATAYDVDPSLEKQARDAAAALAKAVRIQGVFAVEFFLNSQGELLVNEIAPRVHNSAHYSLDASDTSQFENHLRAAVGLPLGPTQSRPFFVMRNLLAPRQIPRATLEKIQPVPVPRPSEGFRVHWYEKERLTPGRKMGHLNGAAETRAEADALFRRLEEADLNWLNEIRKV
jgi:5-(carboxyamino)imidazole ribonucleotide synthase